MTKPTDRRSLLSMLGLGGVGAALWGCRNAPAQAAERFSVSKSDAEWQRQLGPAYGVLRKEATERPYASPLNGEKRAGTYACKGCARNVFASKTKFESGTGWPSFWAPLPNAVATRSDRSFMVERIEVHCDNCGGHLGHVFDDGPKPTGKRYCMNGIAMTFKPA